MALETCLILGQGSHNLLYPTSDMMALETCLILGQGSHNLLYPTSDTWSVDHARPPDRVQENHGTPSMFGGQGSCASGSVNDDDSGQAAGRTCAGSEWPQWRRSRQHQERRQHGHGLWQHRAATTEYRRADAHCKRWKSRWRHCTSGTHASRMRYHRRRKRLPNVRLRPESEHFRLP